MAKRSAAKNRYLKFFEFFRELDDEKGHAFEFELCFIFFFNIFKLNGIMSTFFSWIWALILMWEYFSSTIYYFELSLILKFTDDIGKCNNLI